MKIKIKLIRRFFTILFVVSLLLACSKDGTQGPIGPQGEKGEQGLPGNIGSQGATGEDGEQGELGTANVIYSEWFTSTFPDDIAEWNYSTSVAVPDLTQEIFANGVILVYARYFYTYNGIEYEKIRQLPHSDYNTKNHYDFSSNSANPGRLNFSIRSIDNSPIGVPRFDDYRYVLIPGGIPTSGKAPSPDYSKMTYEEITTHFSIPE